jgi:hypothetical protein
MGALRTAQKETYARVVGEGPNVEDVSTLDMCIPEDEGSRSPYAGVISFR